MTVIEASCAGFKDMADGTVRFMFDVEPRHAEAALRLFRSRGTAAALAALVPQATPATELTPEPETQPERKGGAIAQWLGMRCQETEFCHWLFSRYPNFHRSAPHGAAPHEIAAGIVRRVCGVQSRAELDHDPDAELRFQAHIRGPWAKANAGRAA